MNKQRVKRLKVEIVTTHLAIIRQTKLINPSAESLEAAKEIEAVLQGVLMGSPGSPAKGRSKVPITVEGK